MSKKTGILVFKAMMSFVILGYLFYTAWTTDQFDDLSLMKMNWGWLGVAALFCLTAHVVSYLRWRVMVRALDIPFSVFDAIRIGFIGSFFNLFAFGVVGGDSLRAFYVARQVKHRIPEAIASVLADRLIGLLTMFSFASVAFMVADIPSGPNVANPGKMSALIAACQFIVGATVVGYVLFFGLLLIPRVSKAGSDQKVTHVPKMGKLIDRLSNVLIVYRQKLPAIGFCFLLSSICVVCFAGSIFSVALAITNDHPSLVQHFIIAPIVMTANAIPLPGGIGGMELALDFLYVAFSPQNTDQRGIVIAFTFRFVLLITSAVGAIAWFLNRRAIDQIKEESQVADESL